MIAEVVFPLPDKVLGILDRAAHPADEDGECSGTASALRRTSGMQNECHANLRMSLLGESSPRPAGLRRQDEAAGGYPHIE